MAKVPNPSDYPTENKNAVKPAKKPRPEPIVTRDVKTREKTVGRKVADLVRLGYLSGLRDKIYTFDDYIKRGLAILDIILDGDSRKTGRTNYNRISSGSSVVTSNKPDNRHVRKSRMDFREIVFESRGDAEEVLSGLSDIIKEYRQTSVADLYDLCNITSSFADNKYGWEDLSGASVRRTTDGYILDLPKAIVLD